MSRSQIPDRQPPQDSFNGILARADGRYLLTCRELDHVETIGTGTLVVRYAIRFLGKPHLSVVPGLVALDYGDILTGDTGLEFLLKKSNLHPRADVVGYRNDGTDEMIAVKKLDLALPVEILAYSDSETNIPTASISALIASPEEIGIHAVPERLLHYLPVYSTLDDWCENQITGRNNLP